MERITPYNKRAELDGIELDPSRKTAARQRTVSTANVPIEHSAYMTSTQAHEYPVSTRRTPGYVRRIAILAAFGVPFIAGTYFTTSAPHEGRSTTSPAQSSAQRTTAPQSDISSLVTAPTSVTQRDDYSRTMHFPNTTSLQANAALSHTPSSLYPSLEEAMVHGLDPKYQKEVPFFAEVHRAVDEAMKRYKPRVSKQEFMLDMYAIMKQESSLRPDVKPSSAGARGIMQVMPEYGIMSDYGYEATMRLKKNDPVGFRKLMAEYGQRLQNPVESIKKGAMNLAECYAAFKDRDLVYAAYNAGPRKARHYWQIPETRHYVPTIKKNRKFYDQILKPVLATSVMAR